MKTKEELEMEAASNDLDRCKDALEKAHKRFDKAWSDHLMKQREIRENKIKQCNQIKTSS